MPPILGLRGPLRYLFIVALFSVALLLYLLGLLDTPLSTTYHFGADSRHPIQTLIENARTRFDSRMAGQSKTLAAACKEYVKRYQRRPPKGFDKWFERARDYEVILVDEFDMLMQSLEPFWSIPSDEMRKRMRLGSSQDVLNIRFKGWNITKSRPDHWYTIELVKAIEVFSDIFPSLDMELAFNHYDEPRVLVGEALKFKVKDEKTQHTLEFGRTNITELLLSTCPKDKEEPLSTALSPNFVSDVDAERDICAHPELTSQHGFFVCPMTLKVMPKLLPYFSASKPSVFKDILLPSPWYIARQTDYDQTLDPPWEKKQNELYWRGSSTGGYALNENGDAWKRFHRQRIISFLNVNTKRSVTTLDRTVTGSWLPSRIPLDNLSSLLNVRFSAITQCDFERCDQEKLFFKTSQRHQPERAYKSRLLLDLDGNAFSGRYYHLLASKSAVLKQTIFKEWHDDWLVPWLHYVPISMEMDELPEIVRYLSSKEGEQYAKIVADEGQQAYFRMLRFADMSAYIARAILEMARLVADDREAWTMTCPES